MNIPFERLRYRFVFMIARLLRVPAMVDNVKLREWARSRNERFK